MYIKRKDSTLRLWVLALIPTLLFFSLVAALYFRFGSCSTDSPVPNTSKVAIDFLCLYVRDVSEWGQYGDFIGGILNPIIGLITIILIIKSIKQTKDALVQNEQALSDSNNELKISNDALLTQKNLIEAEHRQNCFSSLILAIKSAMEKDKRINFLSDNKYSRAIRNSFVPEQADLWYLHAHFRQCAPYFQGVHIILNKETNREAKEMLFLFMISQLSIDYIFSYTTYLIEDGLNNLRAFAKRKTKKSKAQRKEAMYQYTMRINSAKQILDIFDIIEDEKTFIIIYKKIIADRIKAELNSKSAKIALAKTLEKRLYLYR